MIDYTLYLRRWNMNGLSIFCKLRHLCLCFIGLLITACGQIDNPTLDTNAASQSLRFEASDNAPEDEINFIDHINPIFDQKINGQSCADSGCHNQEDGEGGNFRIRPNVDAIFLGDERQAAYLLNFLSAAAFVSPGQPGQSKLLLEPLRGSFPSVENHGGGDRIISDDKNYRIISTWISNPTTQDGI
jgi:hypothetical protein